MLGIRGARGRHARRSRARATALFGPSVEQPSGSLRERIEPRTSFPWVVPGAGGPQGIPAIGFDLPGRHSRRFSYYGAISGTASHRGPGAHRRCWSPGPSRVLRRILPPGLSDRHAAVEPSPSLTALLYPMIAGMFGPDFGSFSESQDSTRSSEVVVGAGERGSDVGPLPSALGSLLFTAVNQRINRSVDARVAAGRGFHPVLIFTESGMGRADVTKNIASPYYGGPPLRDHRVRTILSVHDKHGAYPQAASH